jgi:hypothetical protein
VNIWPRPVQKPHPPIWISGGGSVETWQWCAEMDYVYGYLSYYGYKAGQSTMDGFWDEMKRLGKDRNPYLTKYNTQLFAERVTPQLHDVFRLGGPLVAAADGSFGAGALYDKISREDILAHAYAQCRSNKSLPLRRRGAHREQTVRILRTSKRTGSSGGWLNWRLRSGRRHSDRSRSDACTYRRPTANSGRWASRPCGIGSA